MSKINDLIKNKNLQLDAAKFIEDLVNAVLGNPAALVKVFKAIMQSPFYLREQLFWNKFSKFLEGTYHNEDDINDLRAKFSEYGTKEENAERLITYIDRAENHDKVQYLINATRCLLMDFISMPEYFRICNAVTYTLYEDLQFLKTYIQCSELEYNEYVQGLLTSGLMYQSVIDGNNGENRYSFTAIAVLVDMYAVSYDNLERYPNPKVKNSNNSLPHIEVSPRTATDEEVNALFDDIGLK